MAVASLALTRSSGMSDTPSIHQYPAGTDDENVRQKISMKANCISFRPELGNRVASSRMIFVAIGRSR